MVATVRRRLTGYPRRDGAGGRLKLGVVAGRIRCRAGRDALVRSCAKATEGRKEEP